MERLSGTKRIVGFGVLGGVIAGMAFGAFMMFIVAPVLGKPITAPLNMIGAVLLGKNLLMHPSVTSAIVGLMVHMMNSVILGILFTLLWSRMGGSKGKEMGLGAVYGLLVWLGMTYVILPIVGSPMATITGVWFLIGHLIFGLMLGLVIPVVSNRKQSVQ